MIVTPGIRRNLGRGVGRANSTFGFYAPLKSSLTLTRGVGTATFTRATAATVNTSDGIKTALAGEARFTGARRVENLLTSLHNLNDGTRWVLDNSGTGSLPIATPFYSVAPDGSTTAMRLQFDRGAGVGFSRWKQNVTLPVSAIRTVADTIWLKLNTGTSAQITLRNGANLPDNGVLLSITNSWVEYQYRTTSVSPVTQSSLELLSWDAAGGDQAVDVLVWHPNMQDITGASVQVAGEYLVPDLRYTIFEGDSLTVGQGSTGGNTYPAQAAGLLPTGQLVYYNVATGGDTLANMLTEAASQVDVKHDPSMPYNICAIWAGTNDLYFNDTPSNVYANTIAYANARRAAGFKVIVFSILPRSNGGTPANFETNRQAFNTLIRTNWASFADAFVDVGNDANIGQAGQETNLTYYSGDNVHLNNTGYGIVAGLYRTSLYTIAPNTPSFINAAIKYQTSLNGNTVASNVVTEKQGAPISDATLTGTLLEYAATNYAFPSGPSVAGATCTTAALTVANYTLSFKGTGSVTGTGGFVGTLNGTGANNRVSLTVAATAAAATLTVTGSITEMQLELGNIVTSVISTTVAAATRNADVESNTTSGNIAAAQGAIFFTFTPTHAPIAATSMYLWGSYVDANNGTFILHDGTNLIFRKRIAGVNYDATIALTYVAGTSYKMAARWDATNGTQIFLNGVAGTANANTAALQLAATMQLGCDGNSLNHLCANYKDDRIWLAPSADSIYLGLTT